MAGKNRLAVSGIILFVPMIGIVVADLLYKFGNYDTPFLLALCIYALFYFIQKSSSRLTFGIVLILVLCMAMSYIVFGEYRLTERIGEWFYLFFVFGLIQYIREAWQT